MNAPLGYSSIVLIEADNQYYISKKELEIRIKILASFFRKLILRDAPTINNPYLFDIFRRNLGLLESDIFAIALRDNCDDIYQVYRYAREQHMVDFFEYPGYSRQLFSLPVVPFDSTISEAYRRRVLEALHNDESTQRFKLKKRIQQELELLARHEYEDKGFITRSALYRLAREKFPAYRPILKRVWDTTYWNDLPAVLGAATSIGFASNTHIVTTLTNDIMEMLKGFIQYQRSQTRFSTSLQEAFLNLDAADLRAIRNLPSFHELNDTIDKLNLSINLMSPDKALLYELCGKLYLHGYYINGYVAKKMHGPDSEMKKIRRALEYYYTHRLVDRVLKVLPVASKVASVAIKGYTTSHIFGFIIFTLRAMRALSLPLDPQKALQTLLEEDALSRNPRS